jgi:hypothetical protein
MELATIVQHTKAIRCTQFRKNFHSKPGFQLHEDTQKTQIGTPASPCCQFSCKTRVWLHKAVQFLTSSEVSSSPVV